MAAEIESLLGFDALVKAVDGSVLKRTDNFSFSSVATDSRNCVSGTLFVPLIGQKQNGHIYIPQALAKGASVVFVQRAEYEDKKEDYEKLFAGSNAAFIAVSNTMTALQKAAGAYVARFPSLIKIGVTGSSGKTTTKEIIASILGVKYKVVTNEGNLNSETGLPLSVFKIRDEHEVGIFEMGMNRKGEISEIAGVLLPSVSVITNIGTAHIGILGSKDAIALEKKNIFSYFTDNCVGFVPENDEYADFLKDVKKGKIYSFGVKSNKKIHDVSSYGIKGTVFGYGNCSIHFPVPGKHNFSNALAAIAVAEYLHLSEKDIKKGLENVKTIFGRNQIFSGDITLVHDCYNANPDSMAGAIEFCDDLLWKGKKVYVLGDMLELGKESAKEHEKIGKIVAASKADCAVFFGEEMKNAFEACRKSKNCFWSDDMEQVKQFLETTVCNGDLVLLKASNGMKLWRAAEALDIILEVKA